MASTHYLAMIAALLFSSCEQRDDSIEEKLKAFSEGDSVAKLEAAFRLSSYPSAYTPNLPDGEDHVIYFLPDGNLHVMTTLSPDGRAILSPPPFYLPDATPAADRVAGSREAWDDYVDRRGAK